MVISGIWFAHVGSLTHTVALAFACFKNSAASLSPPHPPGACTVTRRLPRLVFNVFPKRSSATASLYSGEPVGPTYFLLICVVSMCCSAFLTAVMTGVRTSFFKVGSTKIELLEAAHAESPIAKFIEKRGEGLHHVAYAVDNIKAEMARLSQEGFRLLNEEPKEGADNKWVCFLHPKDTGGTLIELCQDRT